jgi:GT2 family glycosyltransferase
MGVSIVIPTWNGLSLLQQFLPSVLAAATHYSSISDAPVEIVIVDDGSVDGTVVWLRDQGFAETPRAREGERVRSELRFASNDENLGFGEAANRGFELAEYPLVLLLNNDVECDLDCIAPLVENFEDRSVFAAHCRVFEFDSGRECGTGKLGSFARGFIRVHRSYTPAGAEAGFRVATDLSGELSKRRSNQNSGSKLSSKAPSRRRTFYSMFAGGGSAMFDRRKVLEVGGFEPLLSPFYWEDVELSYRAWKRGFVIVYEPRSVTRHRVSSTIGKLDRGKVRVIEQRNRLIYHWIHLRDARMLASHIAWVTLLAVTAPLRFKPGFLVSCVEALRKLSAIRKRREEEGSAQARTDREVFEIFKLLESDPSVTAYDDLGELQHQAE